MKLKLPTEWDLGDGVVAGVDIGGTQCSVNVGVIEAGTFELVVRDQFETRSERGPGPVLEDIEDRLRAAVAGHRDVSLIGVSCGGPMDAARGIVLSPPNLPGWDEIHVTERLEQALGVRCVLENDANASAVAEWAFGAGRGISHLVYLTFGTGLGAGLILDGAVYRGAGDLAGEVGHWKVAAEEGPLHYGKQGSFEGSCSGSGIAEWYEYLGGRVAPGERVTAELVGRRARSGEPLAQRVYEQTANRLGLGVAMLVDALAPEMIVIGGVYTYATDLLRAGMQRAFTQEAHPQLARGVRVVPAQLGREVGSFASCSAALINLVGSAASDQEVPSVAT